MAHNGMRIKPVNMKKDRTMLLFVICVLIPALALITHCILWLCKVNWFYTLLANRLMFANGLRICEVRIAHTLKLNTNLNCVFHIYAVSNSTYYET